jgi:hypothetical protein
MYTLNGVIMDYIDTWKEVIQSPSNFYRRMSTTGGYAGPLTFAAINFAIFGILTALLVFGISSIFGMQGRGFSFLMLIGIAIATPILGVIGIFIGSAIFYVVYRILGGTGSYEGTVRFTSYASAPVVLYWIPLLGLVAEIYGLYLDIVGGSFVHKISMGKSAIAVLLPTILIFLLFMNLIMAGLAVLTRFAS